MDLSSDTRGIKELAQEVLDAQDASNLSGLVLSWGNAIQRLRALLPDLGTRQLNQHCINQLWASKVHDLARMGLSDGEAYANAYAKVKWLAEREPEKADHGPNYYEK
jgi:hypothetical protein